MNREERQTKIQKLNMSFQCLKEQWQKVESLHKELVSIYIESVQEHDQEMITEHCGKEIERLKRRTVRYQQQTRKTHAQEERELLLEDETRKAIQRLYQNKDCQEICKQR